MKKIISKSIAILLTLAALFSIGLLVFSANAETDTEKPLIELCDVNSKPFIPEEYGMAVSGLEGIPSYNQEIGWSGSYAMTDESTYAHYFWVREFSAGDTVYVTVSSENAYNFRLLGIESGESTGTLTDGKVVFEITQAGQYVLTMLSDSPELTVKSHFNNINESEPNSSGRYVSGKFTYKILEDGTAELRDYSGSAAAVTIPETFYGRKVTGIYGAFSSTAVTSVTIPNTVKRIGALTFFACKNLKSIELPDSVEYIDGGAFVYCNSLETFIIGSGLKKVHESAFDYHNLEQQYGIKEFIVDPDNPYFSSKDGVWYSKDMTTLIKYPYKNERKVFEIPEGVETIAENAFHRCEELRKVVFPSTLKTVKLGAFDWAYKLSEVILNDGLEVIEDSFARTDIRTLHLPESVIQATFWETGLRYIALPESYTGWVSFWDQYDTFISAYIPKGVSEIGCDAFEFTSSVTDIYFGGTQEEWESLLQCTCDPEIYSICDSPIITATVHYNHTHTLDRYYVVKAATPDSKGIADHACVCGYSVREEYEYEPNSKIQGFCGHGLTWDFDFATGALIISGYGDMWDYWDITEFPWYGIKDLIKSIELGEGITSISEYAFENCSNFSKLIIPESVISIGEYAFSGCSGIAELSLGNELQTIGDYAFNGCTGIEKVDLHENITTIGENTFKGCSGVKEFYVSENLENFGTNYISDFVNLEKLYVDNDQPDCYTDDNGGLIKRTSRNSSYARTLVFYPANAPYESYAIPENVYYISSNAFNGNKNLKTIYFPKNLKTIYDSAFAGCTGITDIYYFGTAEEANNITIEANNDCLYNATIHFEHTHSFTETAEKAATCSQDGYVKSICGECGYAETEVIPETGHTSTGWIYYANGVYHKTCSVCGLVLEKNTIWWSLDDNRLKLSRTQSYEYDTYVYGNEGKQFPVDFNFTSSDENVVTVEVNERSGRVFFEAVGLGEATITVTIDGTDISRVIHVTVIPRGYIVMWYVNGERINTYTLREGEPIPVPEDPMLEGYEFVGWSPEVPKIMPSDHGSSMVTFNAVFNKVTKAENFDVTASYAEGCFDEDVSLDVAEIQGDREPGGVYMVEGEYYKQIGFYNIKTVNENGNVLQPNEGCTVTIKMAIPDAYKNRTEFMIYHRFVDGGREQLSTGAGTIKVENGYLIFNVSKFSEFEIFAKADKSEIPDTPVDKVSPSIKITSPPVKTVYACGEDIDLTGIRVIYTNSNGEKKFVSNIKHLSVSGYNSKEVGKQTVTVKYGDCSDTFEVTVKYTFWQWIIKILTFGLFRF
ncbi:MAG: leucine-rich repeat protein [Clostridia bacterium]|nr:leucine-rich repeat protein [Clostridia bacterium]